jgi:hypothetical protein
MSVYTAGAGAGAQWRLPTPVVDEAAVRRAAAAADAALGLGGGRGGGERSE